MDDGRKGSPLPCPEPATAESGPSRAGLVWAGRRLGLGRELAAELVALSEERSDFRILASEPLEADLLGGGGLEAGERLLRFPLLVLGGEIADRDSGRG